MSDRRCLIIGASHAAAQLAPGLRQEGWTGRIIIIGEEPYLPYNRPPLSKTFLAGQKSAKELQIKAATLYEKLDIELILGRRVINLDRQNKQVELDNGEVLSFDKVALTMGARVRKAELPGSDLSGIFYLRNIDDVEKIRALVAPGKKAVIVGGGYIGLETAAMLRKLGLEVTILEMSSRILSRVTAPEVSAFYARVHAEEGITIVTDVTVSSFVGDGSVQQVKCANGQQFSADIVVIGIGVLPNVELAADAGLIVANGIVVDSHCLTSDPDIVAAGDCTQHHNSFYQMDMRLESVQNAVDQAKVCAATLCGKLKEYNALPWFWSDQFDMKLQIAGLSAGYDRMVIRGDIESQRKFAGFYFKGDKVIAVDAVNSPQEFMLGKRIISEQIIVDKELLVDTSVPMKEFLN